MAYVTEERLLSTQEKIDRNPGKAVAQFHQQAVETLARVDDRELYDAKTGQKVTLPGTFTKRQAQEEISQGRTKTEAKVSQRFDEARAQIREGLKKPLPSELREGIQALKDVGATPTEIREFQRAHQTSYLASRLIAQEFKGVPGAVEAVPQADELLGALDQVEKLAVDTLRTPPRARNLDYSVELLGKGEVTQNLLDEAEVFGATYGA